MAGGKPCSSVEMQGPGGKIRVNKEQESLYAKKGYKRTSGEETPSTPEASKENTGNEAEGVAVEDMTGPQLDAFAKENGIEISSKAKVDEKRQIILDALDDEGDDEDE